MTFKKSYRTTYTFGHDHIYRLILKKLKTKQDKTPPKQKQENNSENTWTLDNSQCRTMIPERSETNEVSPVIASA